MTLAALPAILAPALLCQPVLAYKGGDVIVRAGVAIVDPSGVDSSTLTLNGAKLPGTSVDSIDSDTQLGLTGVYMFTDYFGLELLAATPFTHNIKAKGLEGLGIRKVGDTKQLPPTLSAQLYPLGFSQPESKFQPYIGIGLNYTTFWDENASSQLENGLSAVTGVTEKYSMNLDDSWGIAGQIGLDYAINDHFLINAAVWRINIETDATFKGKTTGTQVKADNVKVNPWVYAVTVGYRF